MGISRLRAGPLVLALVLAIVPAGLGQNPEVDPRVSTLLGQISEQRLAAIVRTLQGFETRNTYSSTASATRGIGAARQWIFDQAKSSSSRLQVSFDTYQVRKQGERLFRDVELRNIVAVLPGKSPRRLYVSAHYDSVAAIPSPAPPTSGPASSQAPAASSETTVLARVDYKQSENFAPGANDDGSGTALTMELARVFGQSGLEFEATLVFIAFAGEEYGTVGSALHAQRAVEQKLPIEAVINNDIVGNARGGNGLVDDQSVRVFSEGPEDSASRQLARYIERQAVRYVPSHRVRLMARQDRFRRGGDHAPFNQHGIAAVRVTEANEDFARQHSVNDTADGVSPAYLARNARVDAAALANLALAPGAPEVVEKGRPTIDRGSSGYDARLRWKASPGAVGYRVFWRRAWTPDWEHEQIVGNVTEFVLPNLSIDDYVFGLASVGAGGHESLVAAYVNPPSGTIRIRTR